MKKSKNFRFSVIALYTAVSVLFLVFFLYMGLSEHNSVYKARETRSYGTVDAYSVEQLADGDAPAGIRTLYRWTLQSAGTNENCLCFYVVHHYVQVYFDDELMYSLTPSEDNRIGRTVSSNWISVPVYPEDSGRDVTVVMTPVFESMTGFEPEFYFGSHFSIIFDQLKQDFPHLFLSALCILVGLFIMAVQLYFLLRASTITWDMFFLGGFSVLLGLTRLTDAQSAPILFSGNPMALGYITIGTLFLICIPLLLYVSALFPEKKAFPLLTLAFVASAVCLAVLLCQVLGIAEFKEMLPFSHMLLIATICAVPIVTLVQKRHVEGSQIQRTWKFFLILACGILLDLILFYVNESSSDIIFTIIGFILYAISMFVANILETTRKAYTDSHTGLASKARWNELMNDHIPIQNSVCIMMLDLNGLKHINDTLGHEAGDRAIFNFSNILRNTLPPRSVICRWGGDEFTVLITDMTAEKMNRYVSDLRRAIDNYNTTCANPPIFYAIGCALSTEYPGLSRRELLSVADSQMYLDKQKWYSRNSSPQI